MRYEPALRAQILLLDDQGLSSYQIGYYVGKDRANISRFLRAARNQAGLNMPVHQGRSCVLSLRDERILKRLVLSGKYDTAH